ncbi:MAG: hypothetical protein WA098_11645 [Smithella sp.]
MINKKLIFPFIFVILLNLFSCANQFGTTLISKPDEYTHVYEAKEKFVLRAIAVLLKEKNMGCNVSIDNQKHLVDSDYVISGDWRTKTRANVKQKNWKECEVIFVVTTERKTETGWEVRRLLQKEQYETIFRVIEMRIYEEMSIIE